MKTLLETIGLKQENVGLAGEISVTLKDKYGSPKKLWKENFLGKFLRKNFSLDIRNLFLGSWADSLLIKNLITNAGFAEVAGLMGGATSGAFTYLAIGIGATGASAADTTLDSEITTNGGERGSATVTRVTTTQTNDTLQLVLTWNITGTFAVVESGIFDAASTGEMLARQTFAVQNVVSGDSLEYSWRVKVA